MPKKSEAPVKKKARKVVSALKPNPKNPRSVTEEKLASLKKTLYEFGDLSGTVFNRMTKQLVGGHQRMTVIPPDTEVVITKRFDAPTRTGTVAIGYILIDGESHGYREVEWDEIKEKAANIAANKGAGEWDLGLLGEFLKEIDDFGFDLDLTLFSELERKDFLHDGQFGTGSEDEQGQLDEKTPIECPHLWEVICPEMKTLKIDWASNEAATFACKRYHYSKCMPTGKIVKVGVWEDERFIGVVLFSRGASPFLLKKFGLTQTEGCELTRVALTTHETPVSRIVAIALKFLKKKNPGLRMVVSFADPDKGHVGGIYQAGNWIFSGSSNPTTELYIRGRWVHMRGGYHQKTETTPERTMPGKYRYLMPLDVEMAAKLESLRRPYPKKVIAPEAEASMRPRTTREKGGLSPTSALQKRRA